MPTYTYKCKACGRTVECFSTSATDAKDIDITCVNPSAEAEEIRYCRATRVPTLYAGIRWGKGKDFD